jgi:uncharacterized protein (DUF1501 family)
MKQLTRRQLLVSFGAGVVVCGAGAAVAGTHTGRPGQRQPTPPNLPPPPRAINPVRALVIIELAGGNDGLTTLVPYADPAYRRLRRHTAVDAQTVLPLDGRVGLHPSLGRLHRRGVAVLEGVGVRQPDLSHFEMLRRWWTGDPSSSSSLSTGFLGRLCDTVGHPGDPAVGVSLGTGPTPALTADRVATVSLPDPSSGFPVPVDDGLVAAWRAGWSAMAHPDRLDASRASLIAARVGAGQASRLAEVVNELPPPAGGYGTTSLDAQLGLAARLLAAGVGVRVVHVPVDADYDTHDNHARKARDNLTQLDNALDSFLNDLAARGIDQSTLVATTSEFGRRVPDNGSSGLDHGAASVAVLAGPVRPGVHGSPLSLNDLDGDGNLIATVDVTEYYATLAAWMGVSPDEVLPGHPAPVTGLLL